MSQEVHCSMELLFLIAIKGLRTQQYLPSSGFRVPAITFLYPYMDFRYPYYPCVSICGFWVSYIAHVYPSVDFRYPLLLLCIQL